MRRGDDGTEAEAEAEFGWAGRKPERPPGAASPSADFDLERSLRYRLVSLARWSTTAAERDYEARFGLNLREWRIVALVGRLAPVTAAELALRSPIEKTRISRLVASLVERGLLVTSADARDGRRTWLWLTRAGADLYDRLAPASLARDEAFLAPLDAEEVALLERLIAKLGEPLRRRTHAALSRDAGRRFAASPRP